MALSSPADEACGACGALGSRLPCPPLDLEVAEGASDPCAGGNSASLRAPAVGRSPPASAGRGPADGLPP
eukprot:12987528-Alexandrium_andersonii.AAC.1